MISRILIALLTLLIPLSIQSVIASEKKAPASPEHNYASCSMITAEYLTILQLYQRGIQQQQALDTIEFTHEHAKTRVEDVYALISRVGILDAYSEVNTSFARCARLVYETKGEPQPGSTDYGYYFCAGENKVRFEAILNINELFDLDRLIAITPDSHMDVAITYFSLVEDKGILAAFDYTANNFKACLKQL